MELVEKRAPNGFQNLDEVISREEMDEIARFYKRTAGFDPEILNQRPSLSVPLIYTSVLRSQHLVALNRDREGAAL